LTWTVNENNVLEEHRWPDWG